MKQLPANTLPNNKDDEYNIIATILLNNEFLDDHVDKIKPQHFYWDKTRNLYTASVELWKEKEPITGISLRNYCQKNGINITLGEISDIETQYLSSPAVAVYSIKQLKAVYLKRRAITMAMNILSKAGDTSTQELIGDLTKEIDSISDEYLDNKERRFDTMADVINADILMMQRPDTDFRIYSGIKRLDLGLKGFRKRKLYVFSGDPGEGKTTLVSNIVYRAAQKKATSLIFTLDEELFSIDKTFLAMSTRTSMDLLEAGFKIYDDPETFDEKRFHKCVARFSEVADCLHLVYPRDEMFDVVQIEAEIKRMKKRKNIDIVVVDYASIVEMEESGDDDNEFLKQKKIIERLKRIGRKEDVIMMVISQLNKKEGTISLRNLFGSGAMGQTPDVVLAVKKTEDTREMDEQKQTVTDLVIYVLKGKKNRTGKVMARWILDMGIICDPEDRYNEDDYVREQYYEEQYQKERRRTQSANISDN